MNDKTAKFFAAEIDPNIYKIDLHGDINMESAMEKLDRELLKVYNLGLNYCLIIHGIGEGVLSKKVHESLRTNPIVEGFKLGEDGGSTLVII